MHIINSFFKHSVAIKHSARPLQEPLILWKMTCTQWCSFHFQYGQNSGGHTFLYLDPRQCSWSLRWYQTILKLCLPKEFRSLLKPLIQAKVQNHCRWSEIFLWSKILKMLNIIFIFSLQWFHAVTYSSSLNVIEPHKLLGSATMRRCVVEGGAGCVPLPG